MRVYKYPISISDSFTLMLPRGAVPLHVAMQADQPMMWCAVDPEAEPQSRMFYLCGTGHDRPEIDAVAHIGTFKMGSFVWHVFDAWEKEKHDE